MGSEKAGMMKQLKTLFYIVLWYGLNVYFNIYNKKLLNAFPAPWTVAQFELFAGFLIFVPLWLLGLRKPPQLSKEEVNKLKPVAAFHMLGHVSGIVALGAGAVSFTHIVKSGEPLFTAALGAAVLGNYFPFPVYVSLVPVCAGVAIAALKELSFTYTALAGAMTSNFACAMRGLVSKMVMKDGIGKNMDAQNLFSVLTILAFFMMLPCTLILEGRDLPTIYKNSIADGATNAELAKYFGLAGLFFYTYNEVAFVVLSLIDPISAAVANTVKRVAIIGVSIVVFKTEMTMMGYVGSGMAVLGVMVYSMVKNYYEEKAKADKKKKKAEEEAIKMGNKADVLVSKKSAKVQQT